MGVQPAPGVLTGSADGRREDLSKPDYRRCRDGERGGRLDINWNAAKAQDRRTDIPEPELSPLSKKVYGHRRINIVVDKCPSGYACTTASWTRKLREILTLVAGTVIICTINIHY